MKSALRLILGVGVVTSLHAQTTVGRINIPFSDAKPILEAVRQEVLPPDLRGKTAAQLEAAWPSWVARRDAEIRARVEQGDEDSLVNLLLFGTTFTQQPRPTTRVLAALAVDPDAALRALSPRIDDFVAATASPGANERMQFARQVAAHKGIDPGTSEGRTAARRFLEERTRVVGAGSVVQSSRLLDPDAELRDTLTVFRDRGLSSDTSIFIDHGIDLALTDIKAKGLFAAGAVRRVAIVGPGLDFTDKLEGYDFYPPQTIQPFALVDSLVRLGLAVPGAIQVTSFDLSARVIQHIDSARERAGSGQSYVLVLPRNTDRPWTAGLVKYWQRIGDRVGVEARAPAPPAGVGHVQVRSVRVRPSVVLSTFARDLNIVLQRPDPLSAGDQFDLVLATNILLYYDVFEQSLAAANIAGMLRPGGLFLSNNRIFELPSFPLSSVGFTDVTYMSLKGIGETGDHIVWYRR